MVLGAIVLFMPIFVGEWVIAILGVVLIAAGLLQFVEIIRSADRTRSLLSYIAGVITTLLGVVLFLTPDIALSALLIGLTLLLVVDGGARIVGAFKQTGQDRWWNLFNGIFTIALGVAIWSFIKAKLAIVAISVALGLRLMVHGWTMFFVPEKHLELTDPKPDPRQHPDKLLRLEPQRGGSRHADPSS
jgi:uncharacterized membrane protein HdeD (DUF308 family)